ncbi:hypothetical protein D3C86_1762940 [compost metagenome]
MHGGIGFHWLFLTAVNPYRAPLRLLGSLREARQGALLFQVGFGDLQVAGEGKHDLQHRAAVHRQFVLRATGR